MKKACKDCKVLIDSGSECPMCKSDNLTTSWQGIIIIYDTDSEIAEAAGIEAPGTYALRVSV